VKLKGALLLSAGAHLAGLSVAAGLQAPVAVTSGDGIQPPVRAVLVAALDEPQPEPAARAQHRNAPRPKATAQRAAAPAAPTPPPKTYLALAELDVRPQIKMRVMPQYPEDVLPGTRGRVVLELLIAASGRIDGINVERAEPGGVFEEAAVKAFSGAVFSPAMRRGAPVPALMRVEVSFGD
jgi:protein TonB